jgi:uncharacterized membrane protein HdeD (DUF308 family)
VTATSMETKQRPWGLTLIMGIAAFTVGAILLWSPAKTKVETYQILVALLGLYWVIKGFIDFASIISDHTAWGWKLFIGAVSIVAGIFVLSYPIAAGVVLPRLFVLMLGLWGLIEGVILLIMAFKGGGWAAGILGVMAIIFGIILVATWAIPGSGLAMLWTAAVAGLVGGVLLVIQAFRQRRA